MQTMTFYRYQPSGDYVCDGPDDGLQQGTVIKSLHQLDHVSEESMSENEDDEGLYTPRAFYG